MRIRSSAAALALVAALAACGGGTGVAPSPATPVPPDTARVALAPVPYDMVLPAELAARLSVGPLTDEAFRSEVEAAGATAAVAVSYTAEDGTVIGYMTAYLFPEDAFDAAQVPDAPPPYGVEVIREGGDVLSVWGPLDMPFPTDSADAAAWSALHELLSLPATYVRA